MNYNLVYMEPIYGGWVTFTAHLSLKYNFLFTKFLIQNNQKILEN